MGSQWFIRLQRNLNLKLKLKKKKLEIEEMRVIIINEPSSSSIQIDHLRSLNEERSLTKKMSLNKRSYGIACAARLILISSQKGHWTHLYQELLFETCFLSHQI